MKKYINYGIVLSILMVVFTACNDEFLLDKEQYIKKIYLIGASDKVLSKNLAYHKQEQETFTTVAISGSLLPERDVAVTVANYEPGIAWYNNKYKHLAEDIKYQALDPACYSIPSYSTTIKAGETYAKVPIKINTQNLRCDSLYALSFKIESVSDYEINKTDSTLILTFKMVNEYSGTYLFEVTRYSVSQDAEGNDVLSNPTVMSVMRTLNAVNVNTVRFFNEQNNETIANIKNYCINLQIESDNSVTMSSWESLDLVDSDCSYDPESMSFALDYKYKVGDQMYQITGTMSRQKTN